MDPSDNTVTVAVRDVNDTINNDLRFEKLTHNEALVLGCRPGSDAFEGGVRPGWKLTEVSGCRKDMTIRIGEEVDIIPQTATLADFLDPMPSTILTCSAPLLTFIPMPKLPDRITQERDEDTCRLLIEGLSNGGSNNGVDIKRSFEEVFSKRDGYHQLKELTYTLNDTDSHHFSVAFGDDTVDNGELTTPVYVCFQSTQNMRHAIADLTALAVPPMREAIEGNVHLGFLQLAQRIPVEPFLRLLHDNSPKEKPYRLVFGGHSLAGAIAQLVAMRVLLRCEEKDARKHVHVVTFGAPLVGDAKFTKQFEQQLGGADVAARNCRFFVYGDDIVPRLLSIVTASINRHDVKDAPEASVRLGLVNETLRALHEYATESHKPDLLSGLWNALPNLSGSHPILRIVLPTFASSVFRYAAAIYSAFGTYYKYADGKWQALEEDERNGLFDPDNLPQRLAFEQIKHHLFEHYKLRPRLSRKTLYERITPQPGPMTKPDFSRPTILKLIKERSSTTTNTGKGTVQYHLALGGCGFAFVTNVTSSLDGHTKKFPPLILDSGERLEVTISSRSLHAQNIIELNLNTVFGRSPRHTVTVSDLEDLPLKGKLATVAQLTRRELLNQAFLLTLFSHDAKSSNEALDILGNLEHPQLSGQAQAWVDEQLQSKPDIKKAFVEFTSSTISNDEMDYQIEKTKPLRQTMELAGRNLEEHPEELAVACKDSFNMTPTEAEGFAQQLAADVSNMADNDDDHDKGAGPDRGESLAYCAVAEHFRKARRDRSAKDALNKVVLSTTNVLARTAYPDIELEKGWGSYIMYGLFSIVAVAAGAFAVFGLLGTVVTMMLESAAVVTLTGTLASAAISGVAIHVMDVLTRNHVEYQKCLEILVKLLNLDDSLRPPEPTYYSEKYIVEHGVEKMEAALGSRITYDDLTTQKFYDAYWEKNKDKKHYPLKAVKNDVVARKRALQFLRDVWSIYKLRKVLSSSFMFGIIGKVKTGKSTLLSKFKFRSAPSATEHTKTVELYKWPCAKNFLFIDFPGADDVNGQVAEAFSHHFSVADAFIFVTEADKTDSTAARKVLEAGVRAKVPVLLCLNKADLMLQREEPAAAFDESSGLDADSDEEDDDEYMTSNAQTKLRSRRELLDNLRSKVNALLKDAGGALADEADAKFYRLSGNPEYSRVQACLSSFASQFPRGVEARDLKERNVVGAKTVLKEWIFKVLHDEKVGFDDDDDGESSAILNYLMRPSV